MSQDDIMRKRLIDHGLSWAKFVLPQVTETKRFLVKEDYYSKTFEWRTIFSRYFESIDNFKSAKKALESNSNVVDVNFNINQGPAIKNSYELIWSDKSLTKMQTIYF